MKIGSIITPNCEKWGKEIPYEVCVVVEIVGDKMKYRLFDNTHYVGFFWTISENLFLEVLGI